MRKWISLLLLTLPAIGVYVCTAADNAPKIDPRVRDARFDGTAGSPSGRTSKALR
jgi:hypothetical protein